MHLNNKFSCIGGNNLIKGFFHFFAFSKNYDNTASFDVKIEERKTEVTSGDNEDLASQKQKGKRSILLKPHPKTPSVL